jgi:hypothetical protein
MLGRHKQTWFVYFFLLIIRLLIIYEQYTLIMVEVSAKIIVALTQFQNFSRFGFSRFINFATHLDIYIKKNCSPLLLLADYWLVTLSA